MELTLWSPASRHVLPLLMEACTAAALPLKVLTLRDGTAIAAHPENFSNATALSCRLTSAITFDSMLALTLVPLVNSLNGTPVAGPGYAEELLLTYSALTDEEKARRQSAISVFRKADAAEAVAKAAAAAAAAPTAPPWAREDAADAAAKARDARAEAEATRQRMSDSAVEGNVFNQADVAEVAALEARLVASAPHAPEGAAEAAEDAETVARAARARAEETRASSIASSVFNVMRSAIGAAMAATAAVAAAAPEELEEAEAAAVAAEETARTARAKAEKTRATYVATHPYNLDREAAAAATAAATAVAAAVGTEEREEAEAVAAAAEETASAARARLEATRAKRGDSSTKAHHRADGAPPAIALQWLSSRGDWGFINEKGLFVVNNWSPTLSCNGASQALGAINEKLKLEMNHLQNPTSPYGQWWWRQELDKSDYGECDVANPARVGPTKRFRVAAMDVQPVSTQPLLALIGKMGVRAAASAAAPVAAAPATAAPTAAQQPPPRMRPPPGMPPPMGVPMGIRRPTSVPPPGKPPSKRQKATWALV